jgi:C-terminal processing protease CtpA/Prc
MAYRAFCNQAGIGRILPGLLGLGLLGLLPLGYTQTRPHALEPQLDATKPFVIRETFHQAPPRQSPPSPGIVGLDMMIAPGQYPLVQAVLPGTPAARQGVQPGDRIIAINGLAAMDRSRTEVDAMISDVPGDSVALRLLRGVRVVDVRLTVVSLAQMSQQMSQILKSSYGFLLNSN